MLTYRKQRNGTRRRYGFTSRKPGRVLNFRVPEDLFQRVERLHRFMEPRILAMTGRKASKSEVIRAVLLRGIEYSEREFGMSDPVEGYVLVDEE